MGKTLEIETKLELKEAIATVREALDALEQGGFTLTAGDKEIVFAPRAEIKLEIEGKEKGRKQKLEFELSWKTPKDEDDEGDEGDEDDEDDEDEEDRAR